MTLYRGIQSLFAGDATLCPGRKSAFIAAAAAMERAVRSSVKMLTVLCAATIFGACSGGNKQLSRTDVQLAAGDLRTFAASAQMLVEQCSAGRATETFCRQQSELLSSKVEDAIQQLNGQAGPAESEREKLAQSAAELREIVLRVEQLASNSTDAVEAKQLASTAKGVEDSLRK